MVLVMMVIYDVWLMIVLTTQSALKIYGSLRLEVTAA